MGAEFVAAVQIIVYAGAIMVLFVFVIMLLNAGLKSTPTFKAGGPAGLLLLWRWRIHYRDHCEIDSGRARSSQSGAMASTSVFRTCCSGFRVSVRTDVVSHSRGGDGRYGAGAAGEP